jgi:hypothetical protein
MVLWCGFGGQGKFGEVAAILPLMPEKIERYVRLCPSLGPETTLPPWGGVYFRNVTPGVGCQTAPPLTPREGDM